jgi:hypothetical protein
MLKIQWTFSEISYRVSPPRRAIKNGGLGLKLKKMHVNLGIGTTAPKNRVRSKDIR